MVRTQGLKCAIALLLAVMCSSGCAKPGCASGGGTAVAAVEGFLTASVNATAEADICKWVPLSQKSEGLALARALGPIVASVGIDALVLEEVPSEQEGSLFAVAVVGAPVPYSSVYVLNEGGHFIVAPVVTTESAR